MADFQIQGLDQVLRRMKNLPQEIKRKAALAALRKGARIVVKAAREGFTFDDPDTQANIPKAIASRADAKGGKREGGAMVKVGVIGGARPARGTEDEGHWRLVEFGKEGVPARPFMRPALEENVQQVTNAIVAELDPAITKILAKLR